MTAGSWDDLAAVALLGTARRSVRGVELPAGLAQVAAGVQRARAAAREATGREATGSQGVGSDPAEQLLDVAALATVFRRAGLRCRPARELPAPAPADPRRPAGAAAAARLAGLLGGGDRELLDLWLRTAADRGVRPADHTLPALLDHAVRTPGLAEVVAAVTGPRGRWLARHRTDWATVFAAPQPAAEVDGESDGESGREAGRESGGESGREAGRESAQRTWQLGTPEQRRVWLAALRARDAVAARQALETGWGREAPAERAALLDALATGLGPGDEAFLERCLGDRRGDVRATAARLLTALPGSALARRATARGLAAVRSERHPPGRRLVVTVPTGYDAGMARDQLPASPAAPGRGGGPGAGLLLHVVAAAPLSTWVPALGRSAAQVSGMDVADGWRPVLWSGWARAAVREGDHGWAVALLDDPPVRRTPATGPRIEPGDLGGQVVALLGLLTRAEREDRVAGMLQARAEGAVPVPALLRSSPGPWRPSLARAVLGWLHQRPRLDDPDGRAVLDLAARRLPGELAPAVRALADRWPPRSPSRRLADAAAELMTVRRAVLEELQ